MNIHNHQRVSAFSLKWEISIIKSTSMAGPGLCRKSVDVHLFGLSEQQVSAGVRNHMEATAAELDWTSCDVSWSILSSAIWSYFSCSFYFRSFVSMFTRLSSSLLAKKENMIRSKRGFTDKISFGTLIGFNHHNLLRGNERFWSLAALVQILSVITVCQRCPITTGVPLSDQNTFSGTIFNLTQMFHSWIMLVLLIRVSAATASISFPM